MTDTGTHEEDNIAEYWLRLLVASCKAVFTGHVIPCNSIFRKKYPSWLEQSYSYFLTYFDHISFTALSAVWPQTHFRKKTDVTARLQYYKSVDHGHEISILLHNLLLNVLIALI